MRRMQILRDVDFALLGRPLGALADGLLERPRHGVRAEAVQDRPGRGEQLLVGRVVGGAAVAWRRGHQVRCLSLLNSPT